MSEALTSQHPAEVKPLSEIPEIRVLEDGSKLLAETKAFLVLEQNVHTKKCGAYANEHTVQLIRMHTNSKGEPSFKLVVKPSMTPALRKIRREPHFVKPDGESLLKAINRLDGEPINLYAFEVCRSNPNPFLNLLRMGQSVVRLGFTNLNEALGWYIYAATCATLMAEHDPDFRKVIKQQQGLAEHAAAPHALILQLDD